MYIESGPASRMRNQLRTAQILYRPRSIRGRRRRRARVIAERASTASRSSHSDRIGVKDLWLAARELKVTALQVRRFRPRSRYGGFPTPEWRSPDPDCAGAAGGDGARRRAAVSRGPGRHEGQSHALGGQYRKKRDSVVGRTSPGNMLHSACHSGARGAGSSAAARCLARTGSDFVRRVASLRPPRGQRAGAGTQCAE
jgi:hypothetical protein